MQIEINNAQAVLSVNEPLLHDAAHAILADAGVHEGSLSLAVVDDQQIHRINREYLDHDYPTDVLSFPLAEREGYLEGEVIVSTETAVANADEYGCSPSQELLLYVIHGVLHLVGHRDKADQDAALMRQAEQQYLRRFGHAGQPTSTGGETNL